MDKTRSKVIRNCREMSSPTRTAYFPTVPGAHLKNHYSRRKENNSKGAMQRIDSFSLTYYNSSADQSAKCMDVKNGKT